MHLSTRIALNLFSFILLSAPAFHLQAETAGMSFGPDKTANTRQIVQTLSREHYRKLSVDDALSSQLLEDFIDTIDPRRLYLLQSDLASISAQFDNKLDNALLDGDLQDVLKIWHLFSDRYQYQMTTLINLLSDIQPSDINLESDLSIVIDRSEEPLPDSVQSSSDLLYREFVNDFISLKLSDPSSPDVDHLASLLKRYQSRLDRHLKISTSDIYDIFINAYANLYDPHTSFLSAKSLENFKINMSLSLQGIGAVLQQDGDKTKVLRLITGGPALRSGKLQPGDYIIGVSTSSSRDDIQDIVGWRLDEVVQLIRGEKGSTVYLLVEGSEGKANRLVEIVREEIALEDQAAQKSTRTFVHPDGESYKIGVINLPAFYMDFEAYQRGDEHFRSTTRDVVNLLGELSAEHIDGLIIDLRDNGGGSLREATLLTDLFIDRGPVVQIRHSNDYISRRFRSQSAPLYTGPLVVLINEYSASASEIFAGAIQDYKRGLVIGSQSFGKGTVQTMTELPEGQLKLTTSKFYRVSGESTQHRGVVPDLVFPSIFDQDEVGESNYETALPWDHIHPLPHVSYYLFENYVPVLKSLYLARIVNNPDYQFLSAQKTLLHSLEDKTTLSLNFAQRLEEKALMDEHTLSITNKRRLAKGEQVFESIDELNSFQEQRLANMDPSHRINFDEDFLLLESGNILSDFINLLSDENNADIASSSLSMAL